MTKKNTILQKDDSILRKKAKSIAVKDIGSPPLMRLIGHMRKILAGEKSGVGLAAPQIGASLRLFIVSGHALQLESEDKEQPKETPPDLVFINPEPMRFSRAQKEMAEGCLSVRGFYGTVLRHEKVSIRAFDEHGKRVVRHATGLLAEIFQHELDHLNGILYIDKALTLEKYDEDEEGGESKKIPAHKKIRRASSSHSNKDARAL